MSTRARSRQALSRDAVLAAALEVVDREGLEAITMRRIGEAVGVEAMSLYHYVPNKAAVLDGVFERVLAELPPLKQHRSWRVVLRARALALRDVLVKHPNALPLFATRAAVTEAALKHVEEALAVLHAAGFQGKAALTLFQLVVTFVVGHTLSTYGPQREEDVSHPRYGALDAAKFPRLRAMAPRLAKHDVRGELELGVDVLLEGAPGRLELEPRRQSTKRRS